MSFISTKFNLTLFLMFLFFASCTKFDDPDISSMDIPEPENNLSPCSTELTDDNSMISTTSDVFLSSFDFNNPSCGGTFINGNPSNGFFGIILGEPLTISATYELGISLFPAAGEANLQFESQGISEPAFLSISGLLYIDLLSDGTTVVEWCDVICQAGTGFPNRKSSGRMVCD